ncbi:MAG: hydroxyacid dehydrogenase [Micromonosporaceae bacterium]|nr:hydroxyacid dehydrogenase [Micromonosporaceae bacterium]
MTTRVLLAGDHFVHNGLIRAALQEAVGPDRLATSELVLPWPPEPFGPVAEVAEASGTEQQLIDALPGVEICLTEQAPVTSRVLAAAPDLRLLCVGRGGAVNVNLAAATAYRVTVCTAPGRNATATAEHTLALILAAVRQLPRRDAELRAGRWRSDLYRYQETGPELAGSPVGLVGCGAVGRRVARVLSAMEATVRYFDPYADPATLDGIAEPVGTLAELLAGSLVVSLHARATPETAHLIGAAQLRLMRPDAILVNAARGSLLDYDAAADALAQGRLAAAAFDVFPEEPLPAGSRLRRLDNVILTPHLGGASRQTAQSAARMMAAEVARYLAGDPQAHPAN